MKPFQLTALLLSVCSYVSAQKLPEWSRVYTFDESIIEMNTSHVVLGGDTGRITFRWIFDQPEPLPGKTNAKYKTRLETMEFRCADHLYRYYEISLLDDTGKTISSELMRPPYAWRPIKPGTVIASMSIPACELIARNFDPVTPKTVAEAQIESEHVANFALSVENALQHSLDLKPIIEKFFVADFISRYLNDGDAKWFYNLNRDTATRASRQDLQRFYVASMNAGYLTSLYVIGKSPSDDDTSEDERVPEGNMIPADVYSLIDAHPYTLKYRSGKGGYDFLAENITSVAQMRSYTDLLENFAELMRKHVVDSHSQNSKLYADMLHDLDLNPTLSPDVYLGLPKGTELFDMKLPALHLQFAKIQGEFKIISAIDASQ
jgi:Surface-adhesin protein E